jgi:hypothetical protein
MMAQRSAGDQIKGNDLVIGLTDRVGHGRQEF